MRRISFVVPAGSLDRALDGLMPMLPAGLQVGPEVGGTVRLTARAPSLPELARVEAAVGSPIHDWSEGEAPADWRRRAPQEGERVEVAGRLVVRSPDQPPAPEGAVDIVIERRGASFGSGAHPTTRMCLELLLGLEPEGALSDLGCGLGTLAIAAARLGWAPVRGVDRDPEGLAGAQDNARRNGVDVAFEHADLETDPPPLAPVLLVNAPRAVHARVIEALGDQVHAVVVSSLLPDELGAVLDGYAGAGLQAVARLEDDGWCAALVTRQGVPFHPVAAAGSAQAADDDGEAERQARPPDPPLDVLLDPERVLAAGAALGQLATRLDNGGLIVSSSRLIEQNVRSCVVLVPGLFRFDVTPSHELLGIAFRSLARAPMGWRAEHEALDGFRRGTGEPAVFHGEFLHEERPLRTMLQVLSLADGDQNALHVVAKCAIHPTR